MTPGLDASALLAGAQAETGLDDYVDPTLPERFALAIDHLNGIGLDANGIEQAERVCHWLLTYRRDFIEDSNSLPEDDRTWAFDFRVMTPTAWWRVPMQTLVAGLPTDSAAQYRLHKAMLQQFQYSRPRKYWVLKGFHGFRLAEFFDAYPDANLLWLHRDPVQVAASRTMMMADILDGNVGPIDLAVEAKKHLEMTRASIANTMTNPMVGDARILHVPYADFIADPIATAGRYYAFCGRALTGEADAAMRYYLAHTR